MRRILLFDVLPDDADWCPATTASEVRRRPQGIAPQFFSYAGVIFLAQHAAGHALEAVDQGGYGDLRRVVHLQMNVIIFAVELDQFGLKVTTDTGKDAPHVIQNRFCEYAPSIFGHKDQVYVHDKYTVSSVANFVVFIHRPNYTGRYATSASLQIRIDA